MISFDFISGDDFRKSLETDYSELNSCLEAKAWKAVHVLAGSIIEAVLTDYLIAIKHKGKSSDQILRMHLSDIITACKDNNILTQTTADLSSVVKQYRNLIHPGRVIRLVSAVVQVDSKPE